MGITTKHLDVHFGDWVRRMLSISYQRMFQVWYHPSFIFDNAPIGWEFKGLMKKFHSCTEKVTNLLLEESINRFLTSLLFDLMVTNRSFQRRKKFITSKSNWLKNVQKHKPTNVSMPLTVLSGFRFSCS